jgi:hypothetical protein
MTGGAAFAHGFVFKDMRTALGGMALVTAFIFGEERGVSADYGVAVMWIMAVGTGQVAFRHRMMMGQVEGTAHIEVTGETDVGGFEGIDDERGVAAGLDMKIARAMAGLAPDVDGVDPLGLQSGVTGGGKVTDEFVMTIGAGAGPDIRGARNRRRCHDRACERGAGEENDGYNQRCPGGECEPADPYREGSVIGFRTGPYARIRLHKVAGAAGLWLRLVLL